jgi:Acyl-CoA dehydrogenase, C-terminal domain
VNLEYDPDELEFLHQAGDVLTAIAPVPANGTAPPVPWPQLGTAGWADLGAELEAGELALSVAVDLFRQAGRQLLVEQLLTTGYLLSALAATAADDDARQELQGRLRGTPGVLLGDGRSHAVPVVTEQTRAGFCFGASAGCDVYRLLQDSGCHLLQRWTGPAAAMAVPAELSPGIQLLELDGIAGTWTEYPLTASADQLERLAREAGILHSAALIGVGEQLLDITCEYVRTRRQFGVPIGSFQAVKHGLADVHTELVVAWNAILGAAADGADDVLAPLVARLLAVDAALAAARAGAQFHGGMGFTAELNVHLYLKTVLDGAQRFAGPDDVACELARRFAAASC